MGRRYVMHAEGRDFRAEEIEPGRLRLVLLDPSGEPTPHEGESDDDEGIGEACRALILAERPFVPNKALTPTQRFILAHARDAGGVFFMYRGDRRGTRIGGRDEFDRPGFVAYSEPTLWLVSRGLVEPFGNERHYFRLTDKGRALIGDRAPPTFKSTRAQRFGHGAGIREAARRFHGREG